MPTDNPDEIQWFAARPARSLAQTSQTKLVMADQTKPVTASQTKPVSADQTKPVTANQTKPSSRNPLLRRLTADGIRTYTTTYAKGIIFMCCPAQYARTLITEFWGQLFFYLDAERKHPAPISEKQMNNFILVTSASDDLIPLGPLTHDFLQGDRVRVTTGQFEGVEGVVKRIKGDRRLIVSIDNFTAVATCHIRPEFLEKIPD